MTNVWKVSVMAAFVLLIGAGVDPGILYIYSVW